MSARDARSVRIIGTGRAGGSFARALRSVGWVVDGPYGRGEAVVANGVDAVMVCVSDRAIAEVAEAIEPGDAVLVHVAGSLGLDVLAPHDRRASVHPLVSLADEHIGAQRLEGGATFAVAGDPFAREIAFALGGVAIEVGDDRRAAYHAAACIASNHLVALLGQVERIAATAGVPLSAFWDLVQGSLDNAIELGPSAALTGPAARGDRATIETHLAAIDPSERPAYEALVAAARRLVTHPQGEL